MDLSQLSGAKKALLAEYRKALDELISVISPLTTDELIRIIDSNSDDPDAKSVQAILSHVYSSVYSYSIYIENGIGINTIRPQREIFDDVQSYIQKLNQGFEYCEQVFTNHPQIILEQTEPSKKINTRWGQQYDVEQLMEHAIVHILRHRRQIENIIRNN